MKNTNKNPIFSVFLTIFLDLLGIGLIIPIMAPLILQNQTGLFHAEMSYESKTIIYGLLIASFPIAQFIANPIIGSLSDIFGRRKVLIYSLWGTIFGYSLITLGIHINSLALIILGRIIPGLASGNITIAYSAIADISDEKSKTKNFGLIGMAFGLGFIIGPFAGGELANHNLVSWFANDTPFMAAGILSIINLIIVFISFPETIAAKRKGKITLLAGVKNINKAFTFPSLRYIFTIVFLYNFAFAFFTSFFIVFLMGKFGFKQNNIGLFFGYMGIWIVITQGGLLRLISKKIGPEKILLFSIPIMVVAVLAILLPSSPFWLYIIIPFLSFGNGCSVSSLPAVVSNLGGSTIQGEIMGINQSMNALAQALPGLIGGILVAENYYLPAIISASVAFIAWLLYLAFYKSKHHEVFSIEE